MLQTPSMQNDFHITGQFEYSLSPLPWSLFYCIQGVFGAASRAASAAISHEVVPNSPPKQLCRRITSISPTLEQFGRGEAAKGRFPRFALPFAMATHGGARVEVAVGGGQGQGSVPGSSTAAWRPEINGGADGGDGPRRRPAGGGCSLQGLHSQSASSPR
jgi:hypothetical protein